MSDCDIFVSYAHEDRERIQQFVHALEAEGWSVFWDRTLPPGESWRSYIGTRLAAAPVVIVAWSKHSVESDWVGQEAEHAAKRRALVPVLLDHVSPPLGLGHIQSADLVDWLEGGSEKVPPHLHRVIVNRIGKHAAVASPPLPSISAGPQPGALSAPPTAVSRQPVPAQSWARLAGQFAAIGVPLPLVLVVAAAALAWVGYDRFGAPGSPASSAANAPSRPSPEAASKPVPKECIFTGGKLVHGASVTAYLNATAPYGRTCTSEQRVCHDGALSGSFDHGSCTVAAAPPPPKECIFAGDKLVHGASITAYLNATAPYGRACTSEQRVCHDGALSGTFDHKSCTVAAPPPPKNCAFSGATVAHGTAVTAYLNPTVPHDSRCVSQRRECQDGVLSGSHQFGNCTVASEPASAKDCKMGATTIAHGTSIIAYRHILSPDGIPCEQEHRQCKDGVLSGSYNFSACTVAAAKECKMGATRIPHGTSIVAYRHILSPDGNPCEWQRRECKNGVLSGSYNFSDCTVGGPASPASTPRSIGTSPPTGTR
jgi:hypothetical protein